MCINLIWNMADSSKSGKPGKNPAAAADAEAKAKEKAARKALFEATRGADIAAAKASKEKNKKQVKKNPKSENNASAPKTPASKEQDVPDKVEAKVKANQSPPEVKTQKRVEGAPKSSEVKPSSKDKLRVEKDPSNEKVTPKSEAVSDITKSVRNLEITEAKPKRSILKAPSSAVKGTGRTRELKSQSRVQTLFDHLPKGVEPRELFGEEKGVSSEGIHPGFIALGLMCSHGQLQGSNKRVIALLNVVGQFFDSYSPPPEKDFKDIEVEEKKSEKDIKKDLAFALQVFREERVDKATEAIVAKAKAKIVQDDVVLIFGSSDLVREVIVEASLEKTFSVIIIDGRPYATERRSKGLDIIKELGNKVQIIKYTSITGLSNVIRSVTKVILGAHGLLNNGGVLAHAGTSQIALMAAANNIPVIVCCETLKFCDKSPTDSFFLNEIGTGFGLHKKFTDAMTPDCGPYLVTPVIKYDVTPPELVTAVITDVDILPCTSVPVVLRVQENRAIKS
ncbi:unnamed protein product [Allacma fusca]|uniref:Translation initiation factor eIF-2B subunit delta n=1 Tax=Allacma fusca TaxID=39272 RepID=A0A8J2M8A8_9HEXA|nr:unnamed protein product [Allacma fusca]